MENPAVSARPRVSEGCASLTSLLVSDELSIFLKSAGFRRFFMALALLVLFLPSPPAHAVRTCDIIAGEFPDLFNPGDCYECPDGYGHFPAFPVQLPGVCSRKINPTTANEEQAYSFLCPADTFFSITNFKCNSCDEANGFYSDGGTRCIKREVKTGKYESNARYCDILGGEWDGFDGYCYKPCDSAAGYSKVFLENKCTRTTTTKSTTTMEDCGDRTWTRYHVRDIFGNLAYDWITGAPVYDYKWVYSGRCGGWGIRSGDDYYACESEYNHDVFVFFNQKGICYKNTTTTSTINATRGDPIPCAAGTFDGSNGKCYSCNSEPYGSGWGPVEPQLGNAGKCSQVQNVAYTTVGPPQFLCPAGQFPDPNTDNCYSCDPGYAHDGSKSVTTPGVCFQRDEIVATFVPPGKSTESCVGVGQGTCAHTLVCDLLGGECRSEVPQKGELCDSTVVPCASADLDGNPVDLSCHSNGLGQAYRCDNTKQLGEVCSGLFQGSCADNLQCSVTYDLQAEADLNTLDILSPVLVSVLEEPVELVTGVFSDKIQTGLPPPDVVTSEAIQKLAAPVAARCVPAFNDTITNQFDTTCASMHDWAIADKVTNQAPRDGKKWSYTFGMAIGGGGLLQASKETGVIYESGSLSPGDDYQGRYGCYVKECFGVQASIGASFSGCLGALENFPGPSSTAVQHISDSEILSVIPLPIKAGVTVIRTYNDFDDSIKDLSTCAYAGLGDVAPLVGGEAGNSCTITVRMVTPPPRDGSQSSGGQTDDDGDGDVAGTACTETVSIRPKSGQLQLTWSPVAGAQSYVIRKSTTGPDSSDYATLVDGHVTDYATYLDEGLTNGDTYWYRVAPKDDMGTEFCTTAPANGTPAARTRTR